MTEEKVLTKPSSFSLEHLFKAAYSRTKERFVSYLLTYLSYWGLFIVWMIAAGLIAGLVAIVFFSSQSLAATITVGIIGGIVALAGLIYIGSWGSLALAHSIIAPSKVGPIQSFKHVRPLVYNYFIFSLLSGLFFMGLFPISILTLFILLIVWAVWGIFSLYAYMEYKETKLMPLWRSKAIVSQNFWGVLGRMLLFIVCAILLFFLGGALSTAIFGESELMINIISQLLSVVIGIFGTAYVYEMYKSLPHPKEAVQPQKVWVIISIIGFVLMILGAVNAARTIGNTVNDPDFRKTIQKEMMQTNTRPESI